MSSENLEVIDSLKNLIHSSRQDTTILNLKVKIAELSREQDISHWKKLAKEARKIDSPIAEAKIYNEIGVAYKAKGEVLNALDYYHKSLKIEETLSNDYGIAISLNNIGVLHDDLGDREKAFNYYRRSVTISKKLQLPGLGDQYWNLASFFGDNDVDSSTHYLKLAGKEYLSSGGDYGLGSHHFVEGTIHIKKKQHEKSIGHFQKAALFYRRLNHLNYVSRAYTHIAENYIELSEFAQARVYADSALVLSTTIEDAIGLMKASGVLHGVYAHEGSYKQALEMYELNIKWRDSIKNKGLVTSAIRQNLSYEFKKDQELKEANMNKERALNAEKEKRQNFIIASSVIGFILVGIFAFFVYNRLQITKKQKGIIEVASKEIMDSITYAKRIQSAILPTTKSIQEKLPDSFVLYKPKDVVAGDFYWLENNGDKVLFAVADCTGHGVPGAMVSVVCNNALNRSIREHKLTIPGEILNKTREIVIQEFEKSEEDVKDGMDIALCSLIGNKLQYAGAHNPLWIIRNGEILETKANKQPIGKFHHNESFVTHEFDLQKGDTLYLFSDGYIDQFGGEKGKKLKSKALRELLLSVQNKSMLDQKKVLLDFFESWKGDLEQIDDVCMIGVRF